MDVQIRDESIQLGQFVKLANLAETGGHAKELIVGGEITVNGEVVTARSHRLVNGDVVETPLGSARVVA